jgi:precorrin-2 dehydrogenase/sirohydrochlorin ferrochelatase
MNKNMFYPVSFNLVGRHCVVIGGGGVASRKVSGLLDAGADVTVVSPEITPSLENRVKDNSIQWIQEIYEKEHLTKAVLVFGATNSPDVNRQISLDAQSLGLPVNIADEPENCTFILPAICKKGDIQIAVNTGGAAPGAAAKIRNAIDACIGDEYEELVATLKKLRTRIKAIKQPGRDEFWYRVKQLDMGSFRDNPNTVSEVITSWVTEAEANDTK